MSDKSKIEWTEITRNIVTGCNHCSPGCLYCYAERISFRLMKMGKKKYKNGFKVTIHKSELENLGKPKKPSRVFVNSMSDTFHPEVPYWFVKRAFEIMGNHPQHIYQVLTKRPENIHPDLVWPDNVWCGVTVCTQKEADNKIPLLINVPAKVRFLSIEPMLENIDLQYPTFNGADSLHSLPGLHWVIVGGESGHTDRSLEPDWARSIRDQCIDAKIPFLFKQWGNCCYPEQMPEETYIRVDAAVNLASGEYYRCFKVGKKHAGRLLDGQIWNQYPEVE